VGMHPLCRLDAAVSEAHLEVDLKPLPDPEIVDVLVQRRSAVIRVLTGCSRGAAASDRLPRAREETS
jgi:hypothetical protein